MSILGPAVRRNHESAFSALRAGAPDLRVGGLFPAEPGPEGPGLHPEERFEMHFKETGRCVS